MSSRVLGGQTLLGRVLGASGFILWQGPHNFLSFLIQLALSQ